MSGPNTLSLFFLEPELQACPRLLFRSCSSSDSDLLEEDSSECVRHDRSLGCHRDGSVFSHRWTSLTWMNSSHHSTCFRVSYCRSCSTFFFFLLLFLQRLPSHALPSSSELVCSFTNVILRLSRVFWRPSFFCPRHLFGCIRRDSFQCWPCHESLWPFLGLGASRWVCSFCDTSHLLGL